MKNYNGELKNGFLIFLILLAFFALFFNKSSAQQFDDPDEATLTQQALGELDTELSAPKITLDVSAVGRIGATVSVSASIENINLGSTDFLWYLDDILSQRQSGKSKTEFSFATTKENHIVRVVAVEGNEKITENSVVISSYNVSLVWYADTYVPPEYEGKALPSRGSKVTVTAIPDIKGYSSDQLVYTWYLNAESRVRNVAGEQEFSFVITKNTDFIPVFVEVSNLSGSITIKQAVSIPVVQPSVLIYHQPRQTAVEEAISELSITPGQTVVLNARPFNFHIDSSNGLDYIWKFIGKESAGSPPEPNILTLTIPRDSSFGTRDLNLQVSNKAIITERAGSLLTVNIIR